MLFHHLIWFVHVVVLVPGQATIRIQQTKIVNGIPTLASDYPFMASLIQHNRKYDTPFCGGSLFRKEYPATVITAAHCLARFSGELQVDLHRSDIDASHSLSNNYARYTVLEYIIHSNYDETTVDNDIALVFLDADLTDQHHLQIVSISDLHTHASECCHINQDLKVMGYGSDYELGPPTDTLEYGHKWFINRYECNHQLTEYLVDLYYYGVVSYAQDTDWVWEFVTNNMICAVGKNTDSCQGDSGGPLVKSGTTEQVGIVSWGFGCNNNIPAIYTNVGVFYGWIHEQLDTYNAKYRVTQSSLPGNDSIGIIESTKPYPEFDSSSQLSVGNVCSVMRIIISYIFVLFLC
eukprot:443487_1